MGNWGDAMDAKGLRPPSLHAVPGGVLSLSGPALKDLLDAVVKKGAAFRFTARGSSMYPFIKDGDVITIEPFRVSASLGSTPALGDIVAYCSPATGGLVVHRVIARHPGAVAVRGDNCPQPDGIIAECAVLGRVSRVERGGHSVMLGRGPEKLLVAGLARHDALIPLVTFVRRAVRAMILRLRSLRQRSSA